MVVPKKSAVFLSNEQKEKFIKELCIPDMQNYGVLGVDFAGDGSDYISFSNDNMFPGLDKAEKLFEQSIKKLEASGKFKIKPIFEVSCIVMQMSKGIIYLSIDKSDYIAEIFRKKYASGWFYDCAVYKNSNEGYRDEVFDFQYYRLKDAIEITQMRLLDFANYGKTVP